MAKRTAATVSAKFWSNVTIPEDPDACWIWRGKLNGPGYGQLVIHLGGGKYHMPMAHRVGYELIMGPIPHGLVLDHLCRVPRCVNPAHLEPVTQAENIRRGTKDEGHRQALLARTHCARGHELTPENRYGYGRCKTCKRSDDVIKTRRFRPEVTRPCGVVSPKGNPCQRQDGHDGRHHGQRFAHKLQVG